MTLKKTLVMAILLVLGATYAWQKEHRRQLLQANAIKEHADIDVFPGIAPADITRVAIIQGGNSFSFERGDLPSTAKEEKPAELDANATRFKWVMRRPAGAPADEKKADLVVDLIGKLKAKNVIDVSEQDSDPNLYGLQPPELIVTINGDFGKRVASFGKKVELSGRRYVQLENDPRLFLVDDLFFSQFETVKDGIRDKQPFKVDTKRVRELSVLNEGTLLRFERNPDSTWTLHYPGGKMEADIDETLQFLKAIAAIRVKNFVDDPGETLAFYGLKSPKVVVMIRLAPAAAGGADEELMAQFGEGVDIDVLDPSKQTEGTADGQSSVLRHGVGYFFKVKGAPFIYQYPRPFYTKLLSSLDVFRPHSPLKRVKGSSIERIEVSLQPAGAAATKKLLINKDGEFTLQMGGSPTGHKPDREKLATWLTRLMDFQALTYTPFQENEVGPLGFEKPSLEVNVIGKDAGSILRIAFGTEVKKIADTNNGKPAKPSAVRDVPPQNVLLTFADGRKVFAVLNGEIAQELRTAAEELS